MPPRYAYWTILVDKKPTAFRARLREELLPTANQLRRKNADVTLMWFARGRLWESPEQERDSWQRRRADASGTGRPDAGSAKGAAGKRPPPQGPPGEHPDKRGRDWRPGGKHEDPRARFDKKRRDARADRPREAGAGGSAGRPGDKRPWNKPPGRPDDKRPWSKPPGGPDDKRRPWGKPPGRPNDKRPWGKPAGPRGPRDQRPDARGPHSDRPGAAGAGGFSGRPDGKRPWGRPPGRPNDKRPWGKPPNPHKRDRPPRPPVSSGPSVKSARPDTDAPRRRDDQSSDASPVSNPTASKPKPPAGG